jgi:hypothetical protein
LLTPPHADAYEAFLRDLTAALDAVRASGARSGKTPSYGG